MLLPYIRHIRIEDDVVLVRAKDTGEGVTAPGEDVRFGCAVSDGEAYLRFAHRVAHVRGCRHRDWHFEGLVVTERKTPMLVGETLDVEVISRCFRVAPIE